jgi:hypothetical protein
MSFLELKDDARSRSTYICQDSFEALLKKGKRKETKGGFQDKTWKETLIWPRNLSLPVPTCIGS